MLKNESLWIKQFLPTIIGEDAFPILNIGSSTSQYRKITQPHVQENIFSHFTDEKSQVIHLDMKADEGVDLVGNLYDPRFLQKIKNLKVKTIFCNNILMYLDGDSRRKLSEIFYTIIPEGGYLLISNSHIFPAAPDPKEEYYREGAMEMYKNHFSKFKLIAAEDVEDDLTHFNDLKQKPKFLLLKLFVAFFLITARTYKLKDWKFMKEFYTKNLHKNYSAACLFLQKD